MKLAGIHLILKLIISLVVGVWFSQLNAQSVDALLDSSWDQRNTDADESMRMARQAYQIFSDQKDDLKASSAANLIGINFKNRGMQDSAFHYYRQSLQLRRYSNDTLLIARSLNNIGNLHRKNGDYDSALFYYEYSRQRLIETNDRRELAKVVNSLGIVHRKTGEYTKSLEYLYEALEIQKEAGDTIGIGEAELSLGNFFDSMGDNKRARTHLNNSLLHFEASEQSHYIAKVLHNLGNLSQQDQKYEEAKAYYEQSLSLSIDQNFQYGYAETSNTLGSLHLQTKEWEKAQNYLDQSIRAYQELKSRSGEADALNNIGLLFLLRDQPSIALPFLERSYLLADSTKNFSTVEAALKNLSKGYALLENYDRAYEMQQRLLKAKQQEWFAVNKAKDFVLTYNEQQNKIAQQKATLEKRALEVRTQRLINIGLAILSFFLAGILFLVWQNNRKNKKQYETERQLTQLEKERETHTLRAVLLGQEEERKRIADDLHTSLGVKLAAAKMSLDAVHRQIITEDERYEEKNREAIALVDEACQEIRRISHTMHPIALKRYGLERAITELLRTIARTAEVSISFKTHQVPKAIPERIEVHLYRIVEDLFANVIKHASATNAYLQLIFGKNKMLTLIMEDDGLGFNEESIEEGLGLANIRTRVKDMEAKFHLDTRKGRGTIITIDQIEI